MCVFLPGALKYNNDKGNITLTQYETYQTIILIFTGLFEGCIIVSFLLFIRTIFPKCISDQLFFFARFSLDISSFLNLFCLKKEEDSVSQALPAIFLIMKCRQMFCIGEFNAIHVWVFDRSRFSDGLMGSPRGNFGRKCFWWPYAFILRIFGWKFPLKMRKWHQKYEEYLIDGSFKFKWGILTSEMCIWL